MIIFTDALPKTRSGKIMRQVLKAIATMGEIGDLMTVANLEGVPAVGGCTGVEGRNQNLVESTSAVQSLLEDKIGIFQDIVNNF